MSTFTLMFRNAFRHPLRTMLTSAGICVALLAFTLISTLINAWYSGLEATAKDRLITRNAVSLVFDLPVAYAQQISHVKGISKMGSGNWFGGKYGDGRYMFQQFAVSPDFFDLYPEVQINPEEKENYARDRKGAILGEDVARKLNLKVGDVIQLQGTIYQGLWEFKIDGIFKRTRGSDDTRVMYFHWDYFNERLRAENIGDPDHVGFFGLQLASGVSAAEVGHNVDALFANSPAETLTETETAFVQGFISMSSAIITALRVISYIIIIIMLLVLTNTMLMSSRERYREYAILKSMGFGAARLYAIIIGEALVICASGFFLLCLFLMAIFLPPPQLILGPLYDFCPVFQLSLGTFLFSAAISLVVALIAGVIPGRNVVRIKVTEGLRRVG